MHLRRMYCSDKMYRIGSESCPRANFDDSNTEPSEFENRMLRRIFRSSREEVAGW
jgi:hypothetical protein